MRISSPVKVGFDANVLLLLLEFDVDATTRIFIDVRPADSGRFR